MIFLVFECENIVETNIVKEFGKGVGGASYINLSVEKVECPYFANIAGCLGKVWGYKNLIIKFQKKNFFFIFP